MWTRHFGSTTANAVTAANMALSPDGATVYVSGSTSVALAGQSTLGGQDAFVHAFTSAGAASWIRQISTSGDESGEELVVLAGGDVVLIGTTSGVLDPQATFGGNDVYVERLQAGTGAFVGRVVFGTSGNDITSRSMAAYTDGYVVLGGQTNGTLPFDGQQNAGGFGVFVRRMLAP